MSVRSMVAINLLLLSLCAACGSRRRTESQPSPPVPPAPAATKQVTAHPAISPGRARVLAEIRRSPLAGLADRIAAELSPTVALLPSCLESPAPRLGESRLGGLPDVPDGFAWPSHQGKPLTFLAQIRLADAAEHDESGLLPRAGWLLVFYDYQNQPWGGDPGEQRAHQVLMVPAGKTLRRAVRPPGLVDEALFPRCGLSFRRTLTLPDIGSTPWLDEVLAKGKPMREGELGTRAEWLGEQRLAYENLREQLVGGGAKSSPEIHQLLGREASIQGPVRLECEQLPENQQRGVKDLRLLLQLDSHIVPMIGADGKRRTDRKEEGQWSWGDAGRLYFVISEHDLRKADFGQVCVILQCY